MRQRENCTCIGAGGGGGESENEIMRHGEGKQRLCKQGRRAESGACRRKHCVQLPPRKEWLLRYTADSHTPCVLQPSYCVDNSDKPCKDGCVQESRMDHPFRLHPLASPSTPRSCDSAGVLTAAATHLCGPAQSQSKSWITCECRSVQMVFDGGGVHQE